MSLTHTLIGYALAVPTIDQPVPDPTGPGASILATLGGWALAVVAGVALLGVIICALIIIISSLMHAPEWKTKGWIGVGVCFAGVIVAGSAAAIINAASGFKIF